LNIKNTILSAKKSKDFIKINPTKEYYSDSMIWMWR